MMKKAWGSLLAFGLAAVILGSGYAFIALSDHLFAPHEEVTQLPKDSELNAVRRFDGGADIRLYPFDEKRDDECVPLIESTIYDEAFALWKEEIGSEKDGDEAQLELWRAEYRERLNEMLYSRLDWVSERLGNQRRLESISEQPADMDDALEAGTSRWEADRLADLVGNAVYQASNDMCYIQQFPVWVVQNGLRRQLLLTAAFRIAYEIDDVAPYYFSLVPPDEEEAFSDTAALEQTAGKLIEQFDDFQKAVSDSEKEYGELSDNPFAGLRSFFINQPFDMAYSRESILYGNELWFVMQSADMRLVLPYSPETEQFYGVSIRYGPQI